MMKNTLHQLINLGVSDELTFKEKLLIKSVNTSCLAVIAFSTIGGLHAFISSTEISAIQTINVILSLICVIGATSSLICSHYKKFEFGRLILFFAIFFVIVSANILFQISSGEFIYYLFLPVAVYYLFGDAKKTWVLIFFITIAVLSATTYRFHYGALFHRSKEAQFYILLSNLLISLLAMTVLVHQKIKINAKAYQYVDSLASTDQLTGLMNRLGFQRFFQTTWAAIKREQLSLAVIMCDIDYFKQYNDLYGHLAGDRCLQHVGGVFRELVIRGTDVAARYGGEEFIVCLSNPTYEHAVHEAQNICRSIEALKIPNKGSSVSDYVTISCGMFWIQAGQKTTKMELLIKKADTLLYKAKKMGRNRVFSDYSTATELN